MKPDIECLLHLVEYFKTNTPDESRYPLTEDSHDEDHYLGNYQTINANTKVWKGDDYEITKGISNLLSYVEVASAEPRGLLPPRYKATAFYSTTDNTKYKIMVTKRFYNFTANQRRLLEQKGFTVRGGFAEISTL